MLLDHDTLSQQLRDRKYFADEGLLTAVRLAVALGRPLLLEGEPGVGKTQISHVLADALGRELIRLQCYEGIDVSQVLYEWDYPKQLLSLRAAEVEGTAVGEPLRRASSSSSARCCARCAARPAPCCSSTRSTGRTASSRRSCWSSSTASRSRSRRSAPSPPPCRPLVVLTSNRTRELHDALKRRCLYHWIPVPGPRARARDRRGADARAQRPQRRAAGAVGQRHPVAESVEAARASPRPSPGRRARSPSPTRARSGPTPCARRWGWC